MSQESSFLLFAGTSHSELARQVAENLGVTLGKIQIEAFPDNEIGVQILENVRGRDVFVLQTIARHPNLYLMELLIVIDALKRASARSICAVIPYFGYARQDRKDKGRVPITAKLVANLLETAGVTRVLTLDLHAEQIQGFFDIPVDNLHARSLLVKEVEKLGLCKPVVVAPDIGSIKWARSFAKELGSEYAVVDKRRVNAKQVEVGALIGDVKGRDVILLDDICSTGVTLRKGFLACREAGANRVVAAISHGLFTKAVEESAIETMIVTDSVPLPKDVKTPQVKIVSIAPLFAKAIESIVQAKSISSLIN